jgi:hypothetical protein
VAVKDLTGDMFIEWLYEQSHKPREYGKVFYGTQSDFVFSKSRKMTEIIRFDMLLKKPGILKTATGCSVQEFPHVNKGDREPGVEYFTKKGINDINRIWHVDFKNFGFKKKKP